MYIYIYIYIYIYTCIHVYKHTKTHPSGGDKAAKAQAKESVAHAQNAMQETTWTAASGPPQVYASPAKHALTESIFGIVAGCPRESAEIVPRVLRRSMRGRRVARLRTEFALIALYYPIFWTK